MSRLHAALLSLSALGLALGACGTPSAPPVEDLVVGSTVLGGELHVASFQVEAGAITTFDRDLVVNSDGDILILGALQGVPADPKHGDSRGADLVLRSKTRIVVAGEIWGAPGRDGSLNVKALELLGEDPQHTQLGGPEACQRLVEVLAARPEAVTDLHIFDGGRGGHLILDAPEIRIEKLVGGSGGSGGPCGEGGAGGSIYLPKGFAFRSESPGELGGAGGAGGPAVGDVNSGMPGNGGAGGGYDLWPPPGADS